jgi:hypothetical protein
MFSTRENASIPKLREAKVAEKLATAKFYECGECDKCDKCGGMNEPIIYFNS